MRKGLEVEVTKILEGEEAWEVQQKPEDTGPIMPRKRFWRVRAVTDERGTRPDIPDGIKWVGNTDGEWYVIVTHPDVEIPGAEEITFEEASRTFAGFMDGINGDDVGEKWGVG